MLFFYQDAPTPSTPKCRAEHCCDCPFYLFSRASKRWNWPCITTLGTYRSPLKPTNFSEEANFLREQKLGPCIPQRVKEQRAKGYGKSKEAKHSTTHPKSHGFEHDAHEVRVVDAPVRDRAVEVAAVPAFAADNVIIRVAIGVIVTVRQLPDIACHSHSVGRRQP